MFRLINCPKSGKKRFLFLLRELEILSQDKQFKKIEPRYFALPVKGDGVEVEQGDSVEDLTSLIVLDEELEQSDRFMEAGEIDATNR